MNIELYQDPHSEYAPGRKSCAWCALISACPMWQQGKFSDLRGQKDNPGYCTCWRPASVGESSRPEATCGSCRHNQDGRCTRLMADAADGGWPTIIRVNEASNGCAAWEARPQDWEPDVFADLSEREPWETSVVTGNPLDPVEQALAKRQTSADLTRLTAEVNVLAAQMAQHALAIGRKLQEIKALLPHGEFERYVEENCGFKHRLARQFMRIAAEYTPETLPAGLSVSKVYELLALPSEQREEFMATHDVESATVRQLRDEIKAAKQAAEASQQDMEALRVQLDAAREQLEYSDDQLETARANYDAQLAQNLRLCSENSELKHDKQTLMDRLEASSEALAAQKTEIVEVVKEVPPPDYQELQGRVFTMSRQLRELERPAVNLGDIADDVEARWECICEEFELMQQQTVHVMTRNRSRARVDIDRCKWVSEIVALWASYLNEMQQHLTRVLSEAAENNEDNR